MDSRASSAYGGVYVAHKDNGQWKLVSMQATPIRPPPQNPDARGPLACRKRAACQTFMMVPRYLLQSKADAFGAKM